jgi:hypothetical protein
MNTRASSSTPGDPGNLADTLHHALVHRELWPRIRTNARRFVETERTWRRQRPPAIKMFTPARSRAVKR